MHKSHIFPALMLGIAAQTALAQTAPAPATMTSQQDYERICALLKVEPILKRPAYNYDESKATPFPNLPDALTCKDGTKVADAATWWNKRRPEIVEDFEPRSLRPHAQRHAQSYLASRQHRPRRQWHLSHRYQNAHRPRRQFLLPRGEREHTGRPGYPR